ncbi:MAG: CHAT domain-containing protein, partial [Bacteroidales bacterium]|nr:CHAT domain-containing protein [Bacteroidales bacterium]
EGIDCFNELIRIKENNGQPDLRLSQAYNNLALCYYYSGDFFAADTYMNIALRIKEKLLEKHDPSLSSTLINMGSFSVRSGNPDKGLEYLFRAEEIYLARYGSDHPSLSIVYGNIARIYSGKGDNQKALLYRKKAIRLIENNKEVEYESLSMSYNNLGSIYINMENYAEAINWLNKAISIRKQNHIKDVSMIYHNLAISYNKLGKPGPAEKYYLLAISNTINQYGINHFYIIPKYSHYGDFCLREYQNADKALVYYRKSQSVAIRTFGNKSKQAGKIFHRIGKLYQSEYKYDSALFYYQQSLISLVENFNDTTILSNPEIEQAYSLPLLLRPLKSKAEILKKMSFESDNNIILLKSGFECLELAVKTIEQIRLNFETEESRLVLAREEDNTFIEAINMSNSLYKLTGNTYYKSKAFEYSEKSKSANLLAAIRNSKAVEFGGIPVELQKRERTTNSEINSIKELLYEELRNEYPDSVKLQTWENLLFVLNRQKDSLTGVFENFYPKYYSLKFSTDVIDTLEVQNRLGKNDVLLEFNLSDTLLISIFQSSSLYKIHTEVIDSSFHNNLKVIRNNLTARHFSNGVKMDYTMFTYASNYLYQKLISPFRDLIKEKHLIIVPDEYLAYVPFEILISKLPEWKPASYRDLPYLLRTNSVSYTYSATLLRTSNKKRQKFLNKVLAFAPNYPEPELIQTDIPHTRQQYRDNLYPIPGVKDEVEFINSITNSDVFFDNEASEKNFKDLAPSYDILHLAMHTIIDDSNPLYSKLAFTELADDTIEDGLLNASEIYGLTLNARLAVLSSCNSGTGKLLKGEGVMSLARGFIYAGCPDIIMTLWEVEDRSGAEIIKSFYSYLKKGYSTDKALQLAKLRFLDHADMLRSHPYFWSPYIQIGNYSPVYLKRIYLFLAIVIIVLSAGGIILVRVRNSKKK